MLCIVVLLTRFVSAEGICVREVRLMMIAESGYAVAAARWKGMAGIAGTTFSSWAMSTVIRLEVFMDSLGNAA